VKLHAAKVVAATAASLIVFATPLAKADVFTVGLRTDASDLQPGNGQCDSAAVQGVQCTLRAALEEANALAGRDRIAFAMGGAKPVKTISPLTTLPEIIGPVTIDGYTQAGAEPNTLAAGSDAKLRVVLRGTKLGASGPGLEIIGGGSTVRGLVVNDFQSGIELRTGGGNRLTGNFIGTNPGATAAKANNTNIVIAQSSDNLVGGTTPAARNIISASINPGVSISGVPATPAADNRIIGNHFGTDKTGTVNLGNGTGAGGFDTIYMIGNVTGNEVGGTAPGAANVIAYSGSNGVNVNGDNSTGNPILSNSIYGSFRLGINIAGEGTIANDLDDPDVGGNLRQNHPVITDAERTSTLPPGTRIQGTLNSTPSTTFTLQFFSNPVDETIDEGQRYLGQTAVSTDAGGDVPFNVTLETGNIQGSIVTATATDSGGNTSEFSPGRIVDPPSIDP
jgi:hypothetical protein